VGKYQHTSTRALSASSATWRQQVTHIIPCHSLRLAMPCLLWQGGGWLVQHCPASIRLAVRCAIRV
jgi:hypothetical protein